MRVNLTEERPRLDANLHAVHHITPRRSHAAGKHSEAQAYGHIFKISDTSDYNFIIAGQNVEKISSYTYFIGGAESIVRLMLIFKH